MRQSCKEGKGTQSDKGGAFRQRPEGTEGTAMWLAFYREGSPALRTSRAGRASRGQATQGLEDHGKDLGLSVKPPEAATQDNEIHLQQDLSGEWMGDEGTKAEAE